MQITLKALLLTTALGFGTAAGAVEQPPSPHDHTPSAAATAPAPSEATKPAGMMGGKMDMDAMRCMGLSDERLATLKGELGITDRQLRAWSAYAATAKVGMHPMPAGMTMPMPMKPGGMRGMMGDDSMMAAMMSKPLPERLEHHEMMMKAHLKGLHKVQVAVSGLYRVLTPEQRVMADKRLCGGMAH